MGETVWMDSFQVLEADDRMDRVRVEGGTNSMHGSPGCVCCWERIAGNERGENGTISGELELRGVEAAIIISVGHRLWRGLPVENVMFQPQVCRGRLRGPRFQNLWQRCGRGIPEVILDRDNPQPQLKRCILGFSRASSTCIH